MASDACNRSFSSRLLSRSWYEVLPIPEPNPTFIDTPAPPEYALAPAVVPRLRHPRGDVGAIRASHIHSISLATARAQIAFESMIRPATPYPFPVPGPSGRPITPEDDNIVNERVRHPSDGEDESMEVGYEFDDLDHSATYL